MNDFLQVAFLLGAFLIYMMALPGAQMLGNIGSSTINLLLMSLIMTLVFYISIALYMLHALVFSTDPDVRITSVILSVVSLILVVTSIEQVRTVQKQTAAAERKKTLSGK